MRIPLPSLPRTSAAISPTAHYTGHVWSRHGLSHPAFATREGALMHLALRPTLAVAGRLGGPSLDRFLLARHRRIDERLGQAIAEGRVGQVVEVACGMSPRGWRFTERHPGLRYVEADLPAMAARKRAAHARAGSRVEVVELDALADDGPRSIAAIASRLDPDRGLAIVAEGLVNYFDEDQVRGMWRRWATVLRAFPHGVHLADLHLGGPGTGALVTGFTAVLGAFVRGEVHLHFDGDDGLEDALRDAGFDEVRLHRIDRLVRVLEATTG